MKKSKKTKTRLSEKFIQATEAFLSIANVKHFAEFLGDAPIPSHSVSGIPFDQFSADFMLLLNMLEIGAREKKRLKLRNKHWKKP